MASMLMWRKFPLSIGKLYRPSWIKSALTGHGSSCTFSVDIRYYRQPNTSSEPKRTGAVFMSCDTPFFYPGFCLSIFSLETQHCAQYSRSLWGLFLMTSQFHNDIEQQLTSICTGCSHFYFQTIFIPLS